MGVSERSNKTIRRTVRAVSAKESAHAVHASHAAVRPLILSTPRPSSLAPSITTSLYPKIACHELRKPLRGSVSEPSSAGLSKIQLPIEQAIYACIHETGRGVFEVVCGYGNQPLAFRNPPHPSLRTLTLGDTRWLYSGSLGSCRIVNTWFRKDYSSPTLGSEHVRSICERLRELRPTISLHT